MRGDEFKTYAANLRNKTGQFKKLKEELADLRQETVVLSRTEAILKSRCKGLEGFMKDLEERHGVEGYTATEDKLEQVSSLTAALNQTKGKTLEEISKIVTDINQALKERKNKLAPQIKELRSVRGTYQELETAYLEKKGIFENTAAGLESERVKLEQECGSYQDECLREESRYHLLNCMMQKTTVDLERTRMEDKFSRNDGRLLPDFKTFSDLYQNKISQQQSLSQALRKHQNALKENAPQDGVQRAMFDDLRRLLDTKTVIHRNKEANEGGVEDVNVASFEEYGGTNVMKIDQGGP